MKQDIEIPKVTGVSVAIVTEANEEKTAQVHNVYLLNLKDIRIENVMVSSSGYGQNLTTGEEIRTSTLRHYIGEMKSKSFKKIEPIMEEVFGLNNQFWVSFYVNKQVFDKKFIFLPETIVEGNKIVVPLINQRGVMI